MSKGALIIGSSAAGIQAAIDLADSGIKVDLVESLSFLGNPDEIAQPQHRLNTRLLEIARHSNVTVWTNTCLKQTERISRGFHVQLYRRPRYVDLSKCTACGDCIPVCPVIAPGTDHKAIYLDGQPGCAAIDKQGISPCAHSCPGGVHVQGYVALIAQGRFQEAIDLIREAIPFPGICGRVCTHPCEINCRRSEVDKPVSIRLLKRFVSDWELTNSANQAGNGDGVLAGADLPADAQKVAIVGAGPGGMTVAKQLAKQGYAITVFERLPVIGGMMAAGIPEYRLPRDVIAREYQTIQNMGVEIRLNTSIGPHGDHSLDDLFALGYNAICLATGAHKGQRLGIPGEDLTGVVQGIELLKTINLTRQLNDQDGKVELQKMMRHGADTRAAVLGGGNTAMDTSRSLKRLGVRDVRILYRRSRNEMPATPEEVEEAEQEGVTLEFLTAPVHVLGSQKSGVTGLECIRMKLGEADASGRRRPIPIEGSNYVIDLDLIVLAIGQSPDLSFMEKESCLSLTRNEWIFIDPAFMTSRPGVFAIGDAVSNENMAVIEAIGMGKKAAVAINSYLRGQPTPIAGENPSEKKAARREMTREELVFKDRVPTPLIPLEKRIGSFTEAEMGYTGEQALAEAQRCLACGPCSECLACEKVCKPGAIIHGQQPEAADLDVGVIIYAADPADFTRLSLPEGKELYLVPPGDTRLGSAVAALAMRDLIAERKLSPQIPLRQASGTICTGIFICQCGGAISRVVDTESLRSRTASFPGVVYTKVLPFSCSPEATEIISAAVRENKLEQVVLAGCACCSIDQVCTSCTFQRLRCKENLGMFFHRGSIGFPDPGQAAKFDFVNIREHCAWVHSNEPTLATDLASTFIAAAVANIQADGAGIVSCHPIDRSALILGSGEAAPACHAALNAQDISTQHIEGFQGEVRRTGGQYVASRPDGTSWHASALVLAPKDSEESKRLFAVFGSDRFQPRILLEKDGLETHRPGVFYCDPSFVPAAGGMAAAARAAAWLGSAERTLQNAALVDPSRCRACGTCIDICEFGAPGLVGEEGKRTSWIDPVICNGCETCAAHCPSGAIQVGNAPLNKIETMITTLLV